MTALRTSATWSTQKSWTSLSVLPVSATSSAIRTFLSEKSIALGTGASMTGISRVVPTPV
ncbi:hypothetical protein SCALM49S_05546 [Streptomyces californicus]